MDRRQITTVAVFGKAGNCSLHERCKCSPADDVMNFFCEQEAVSNSFRQIETHSPVQKCPVEQVREQEESCKRPVEYAEKEESKSESVKDQRKLLDKVTGYYKPTGSNRQNDGDKCNGINKTTLVPELNAANQYIGNTYCSESCGSFGCGCGWFSSGCLFYRIFALPKSMDTVEVFRCLDSTARITTLRLDFKSRQPT
uniref:Phlebovirus_G2 domain-containing protein n=1 Tax=Caenorhabditis japonica TaxID=281687 RepID=A0A8R1E9P2_CAEJA